MKLNKYSNSLLGWNLALTLYVPYPEARKKQNYDTFLNMSISYVQKLVMLRWTFVIEMYIF